MEKRSEPAAIKGTAEGKTSWVMFHQFRNQGENILSETFRRNENCPLLQMVDFVYILLGRITVKGKHRPCQSNAKDIGPLKQDNTYKANGENMFLKIKINK